MVGVLSFASSLGNAIGWLLPSLCYIVGGSMMISAIWGFYARSTLQNGLVTKGFAPEILFLGSGIFLSFPKFLNMLNASFGFTATASLVQGQDGSVAPYSFDAASFTQSVSQGPTALIKTMIDVFDPYFISYGALIAFLMVKREIDRARGRNDSSAAVNMTALAFSMIMMNVEKVSQFGTLATHRH